MPKLPKDLTSFRLKQKIQLLRCLTLYLDDEDADISGDDAIDLADALRDAWTSLEGWINRTSSARKRRLHSSVEAFNVTTSAFVAHRELVTKIRSAEGRRECQRN